MHILKNCISRGKFYITQKKIVLYKKFNFSPNAYHLKKFLHIFAVAIISQYILLLILKQIIIYHIEAYVHQKHVNTNNVYSKRYILYA